VTGPVPSSRVRGVLVQPEVCEYLRRLGLQELIVRRLRNDGCRLPREVAQFLADVFLESEEYRSRVASFGRPSDQREGSGGRAGGDGSATVPPWIDTKRTAELLSVSTRRVSQLVASGELRAQKDAGRLWIDPASVLTRKEHLSHD
jgi:hypothetical protein